MGGSPSLDANPRGATIVLTQADEAAGDWIEWARGHGVPTAHCPLLSLSVVKSSEVLHALSRLATFDHVFVPSPSAVQILARLLQDAGTDWPDDTCIAVPGPGTARTVRQCFGARVRIATSPGPVHDALRLVESMPASALAAGARWLVLRRPDGRSGWIEKLRATGASVQTLDLYLARPVERPSMLASDIPAKAVFIVGSASQLDTLDRWLHGAWQSARQRLRDAPLLVPHPAVAAHARVLGHRDARVYRNREAVLHTLQSMRTDPPWDAKALTFNPKYKSSSAPTPRPDSPVGDAAAGTGPADSSSTSGASRQNGPLSEAADAMTSGAQASSPPSAAGSSPPGTVSSSAASAARPSATHAETATPASPSLPTSRARPSQELPEPPRHPEPRPAQREALRDVDRDSRAPRHATWPLWLLLLLLVCTVGVAAWLTQEKFHSVERDGDRRLQELASRTQEFDARIRESDARYRSMQDSVGQVRNGISEASNRVADLQKDVQTRLGALDGRISDSAARQERIESLYSEIMRSRTTSALAEAQQAVANATRYLQLHNNVPGAIAILEDGAKVLQASDPADSTGVRKRMLADIERLRAVPAVDMDALTVRLDAVLDSVARMPMLAEAKDVPGEKVDIGQTNVAGAGVAADRGSDAGPAGSGEVSPAGGSSSVGAGESTWDSIKGWFGQAFSAGARGIDAATSELKDVVTIQKVDNPELLLLGPQQRSLARDNLTLLLLNARIDLQNRRESVFRADAQRAANGIRQLFDTRNDTVKASLAALDQLKSATIAVSYPSLADTAAAIGQLKSNNEKH